MSPCQVQVAGHSEKFFRQRLQPLQSASQDLMVEDDAPPGVEKAAITPAAMWEQEKFNGQAEDGHEIHMGVFLKWGYPKIDGLSMFIRKNPI